MCLIGFKVTVSRQTAVEKGPKHFTINRQNCRLIFTINTKSYSLASERGGHDLGGARLSEISYTYDPPIYDITSSYRVCREAPRWTPDAIWFRRYFHPQGNGIICLECPEC